jgi:hypothetical protein
MNPAPSLLIGEVPPGIRVKSNPTKLLYTAFALLLMIATLLGFQQFYLHGKAYPGQEILPAVKPLIIAHGVAMSCWIVLFLLQPLLIVGNNRRLHVRLGKIGAALAICMVLLGLIVPAVVTHYGPEFQLWGLTRRQFMAIPMLSITLFGAFVAIGVWKKHRSEIHRPMMLLATLSIVAAATDRITGLPELYGATIWGRVFGPFFPGLVIGAAFLVVKWLLTRSFDRWYTAGFGALMIAWAAIMQIATSGPWVRFASFLAG